MKSKMKPCELLCLNCPNLECKRENKEKCLTYRALASGRYGVVEAIERKYEQQRRHRYTDTAREEIFKVLKGKKGFYSVRDRKIARKFAKKLAREGYDPQLLETFLKLTLKGRARLKAKVKAILKEHNLVEGYRGLLTDTVKNMSSSWVSVKSDQKAPRSDIDRGDTDTTK